MKFLLFIGCLAGGYFLIKYPKWLVDSTGIRFDFFESNVGPGTSYSILKLIGLMGIIFGFWWLFH